VSNIRKGDIARTTQGFFVRFQKTRYPEPETCMADGCNNEGPLTGMSKSPTENAWFCSECLDRLFQKEDA